MTAEGTQHVVVPAGRKRELQPTEVIAMPDPVSLAQIDLTPIPGKQYFTCSREWREEFIYFLMVDRFHDDQNRAPLLQANRTPGIVPPDNAFYGGKIQGVKNHLDYIAGLGRTAIW